jgi:hypothetical protein
MMGRESRGNRGGRVWVCLDVPEKKEFVSGGSVPDEERGRVIDPCVVMVIVVAVDVVELGLELARA